MTLLVDTSAIVAAADRKDPDHVAAAQELLRTDRALVVPAPVTAEADYLLGERAGRGSRLAFLDDLAAGRLIVECLTREEYGSIAMLERRYEGLDLGLADLSLVVLAARLGTRDLVTFDHRHFRVVTPFQGGAFRLLPVDR